MSRRATSLPIVICLLALFSTESFAQSVDIAYVVELRDGSSMIGVILDDSPAQLVLGQINGANLTIPRTSVAGMKASPVSLMPEGLWQVLNPQQQRDLMTFLLTEPPAGVAK